MAILTIKLPESLFAELKTAADLRQVSPESLLLDMVCLGLREFQAEQRFRERAARGTSKNGLTLLERIALPVYHGQGGLTAAVTDSLTNRALLDATDEVGKA